MKKIILLLAICFIAQTTTAQWSKGKGNGFYKLSAWNLKTDQHYTNTGKIDPNVTRNQFNLNVYGEYGITNKFDVIAYIPFFTRATQNNRISGTNGATLEEGSSLNSIGDIDLGVNYNFYKKNSWSASVKLLLGLPTGEESGGNQGNLQNGDGEFNQFLSTALGFSTAIKGIPVYAKTYIGINNRTENFSDEFRFGLEGGANILNNKLWLIARLDVVESLQNGSKSSANNMQGSIFANNIEFVGLGAEVSYLITKKLGVSFTYGGAISGRLIAANPSYSLGVFLDVK